MVSTRWLPLALTEARSPYESPLECCCCNFLAKLNMHDATRRRQVREREHKMMGDQAACMPPLSHILSSLDMMYPAALRTPPECPQRTPGALISSKVPPALRLPRACPRRPDSSPRVPSAFPRLPPYPRHLDSSQSAPGAPNTPSIPPAPRSPFAEYPQRPELPRSKPTLEVCCHNGLPQISLSP